MMKIDPKALGVQLAGVVKGYCTPLFDALTARMDSFQKRLEELPVPENGKDGADGKDGASVSLDDVLPVLEARIKEEIAVLPPPENGKDGASVTLDDVRPLVEEAVAAMPIPIPADGKDGTSVTVDDVLPIIEEKVAEAVAAIPVPQDGKDGTNGADGQSVTVDDIRLLVVEHVDEAAGAVRGALEETVKELVAAIPVPVDGKDGENGTNGQSVTVDDIRPILEELVSAIPVPENGKDGVDGTSVSLEDVKPLLKTLVAEIPAPRDGNDGRDGRDAEDGRDALEIEVLPMIDPAKSYPRGSYATHKGGLWRARRNTDGMEGWDCIVRGIESVMVTMGEDLRTFELKHVFSDGERVEQFTMPVVLYRGVFSEGTQYAAGDAVTWAGSVWIARAATDTVPNGANGQWTLSVKEGRAGRNAGDGGGTPIGQTVKVS